MGEWKTFLLGLAVCAVLSLLCCSALAWPTYAQDGTATLPPPPAEDPVDLGPVVDAIGTLTVRVDAVSTAVGDGSATLTGALGEAVATADAGAITRVADMLEAASTPEAVLAEVSDGVFALSSVGFQTAILLVVAVVVLVTLLVVTARR